MVEGQVPPKGLDGHLVDKKRKEILSTNCILKIFLSDPCAYGVRSLGRNVFMYNTVLTLVDDPS